MIEIIHLILNYNDVKCYFCNKLFIASDFPLKGKDKIHIHHVTYNPEVRVLTHESCHKKFHVEQKKKCHVW